jgi:hypothetical protein
MKTHLHLTILVAIPLFTFACGSSDDSASNNTTGGAAGASQNGAIGGASSSSTTGGVGNLGGNASDTSAGGNAQGSSTENTGGSNVGGSGTSGTQTQPGASTYAGKLFINEVCPSNKTGPMDEAGAYPDFIELYNGSTEDVTLSGFHLTDSVDEPAKSSLDATLTVKAGGVLLLWADGDQAVQGALHTTFSLSAAQEGVYLFDAAGKLVDSTTWTNAAADTSFARFPDGTGAFSWCAGGSPNRTNGASCKAGL